MSLNGRKSKDIFSAVLNGTNILEGVTSDNEIPLSTLIVRLASDSITDYRKDCLLWGKFWKIWKRIQTNFIDLVNYPFEEGPTTSAPRWQVSLAIYYHLGWMREFLSTEVCRLKVRKVSNTPSSLGLIMFSCSCSLEHLLIRKISQITTSRETKKK